MSNVIGVTAATPAPAPAAATNATAMGSDTFLKLLVAQLKYQDPSKPADSTAFLAQTAQFQMVEKLQQLADQNTQLLAEQHTLSAIGLVGRSVSYSSGTNTAQGIVTGVQITPTGPVLSVGNSKIPLADVTDIHAG
ncbi:MAG: flagellar hook capping protein [Frankiales bacterium]|jgi:flagellar basal-body rod modification protein FlgD|nr:flagellar hook capping protein [Frankiales bacterium]